MAQRPQLKQLIKIQSRQIFNIKSKQIRNTWKTSKIPIPLRIRATLRRHVRDSTRDCNYSWSPASYPCKGNNFQA
ncbi:hypothetical protein MTR_4g046003 [Medicago truncatula]|uniref:Uncharacterized protein n=1 Tax=Medicago truncatula TaxID=3880 RepID=A0A072UJJ5_MEDTR|nr:hypothetical protein MTR_4g046003 [Medicago truncatula]